MDTHERTFWNEPLPFSKVLVTQNGQRWEFRPSQWAVWGKLMFSALAVGFALFLVILPAILDRGEDAVAWWVWGFAVPIVGAYGLIHGFRSWRSRKIPLVIEDSGRVLYGERQICDAGTVRGVLVEEHWGSETQETSYTVTLRQADGNVVELPYPYFRGALKSGLTYTGAAWGFFDRASAKNRADKVAESFAKALGVEVRRCVYDDGNLHAGSPRDTPWPHRDPS